MPTADGGPVAGEPDSLEVLALQYRRVAAALRADLSSVRSGILVEGWSGEASRAFGRATSGLPRDLVRAADTYDSVAAAVTAYAVELRAAQRRGRVAEAELEDIELQRPLVVTPILDPMTPAETAVHLRRVEEFEARRGAALRLVAAAHADASRAAAVASRQVRAASDAPYDRPGVFQRVTDGVGDWVEENAEVLADIAGVLTIVSSVATALSFIPAMTALAAPLATTAAVAALAINAALAARSRAQWQGVLVDAVTTAVPGGKVARGAVRPASGARRGDRARDVLARVADQQTSPDTMRRRKVTEVATPCD